MKKLLSLLTLALLFGATSCDNFLDEMPDNRAEIDNEEKVAKLLVSAYPGNSYFIITEMASDNIDDFLGSSSPYNDRFQTEVATWADVKEDNNESPSKIWEAHYLAIANANQAIESMKEMGITESLKPYYGEALLSRAFNHFMLVNLFCLHYNKNTSNTDLGIPYMEHPETDLNPKYERGTVAEVYELIEKDLEEGLPLITDNYTVPKYHFNVNAAYAFASRFYLYYEKYDKVITCANKVLGSNPIVMMRDWNTLSKKTFDYNVYSEDYISASHKSNFLLTTGYSSAGLAFGPWTIWKRFAHTKIKNETETLAAPGPWGNYSQNSTYYVYPRSYGSSGGTYNFSTVPKIPYLFEYTDPVAGIGYRRSVFPFLQAEEVLLNRAEAYIFKGDYDSALEDMIVWQKSRQKSVKTLTRALINSFYDGIEYFEPLKPTTKHKLNPLMSTPIQSGEMENMIHCLLQIRRIHTLFEGLRWFDVKRYGIEIHRRLISSSANLADAVVYDELLKDDPRRAIQIPYDVTSAGLTPNPR